MTLTAHTRDATFLEMRKLVHHTTWRFLHKHGGDHEEAEAEAMLAYCLAYRDFDRGKGTCLSTLVVHKVWWQLVRWREREMKNSHERIGNRDFPQRRFSFRSLLTDLSEDANTVFRLAVMEIPEDLQVMRVEREPGGITSFLLGMGWSVRRAFRAFKEIKEALS